MRDFKKVFRRLAVTAVLAVFVMASAIPSLAATYQDGTYSVPVSLSEGRMSHNAIVSPCSVTISGGQIYATIVFKRVSDDGIPQYSYFTTTAGTVYPQQYGAHAQIFNSAPLPSLGSVNVTMETTAIVSDGTLWEVLTALYFRWTCLPDCAVPELDADYRRNNRRLS